MSSCWVSHALVPHVYRLLAFSAKVPFALVCQSPSEGNHEGGGEARAGHWLPLKHARLSYALPPLVNPYASSFQCTISTLACYSSGSLIGMLNDACEVEGVHTDGEK